jgi:hypothetical protein
MADAEEIYKYYQIPITLDVTVLNAYMKACLDSGYLSEK